MQRNTSLLEDQLFSFRQTVTARLRRNIARELQAPKHSSQYQSAFRYYALLQNTDSTGTLRTQEIEEIIRSGHSALLEEKSIFRKGLAAVSSFFQKDYSVSKTLETLTRYHTFDKKVTDSLTNARASLLTTTHDSVRTDLLDRIQRLEKQQKKIRSVVLSDRRDSLAAYVLGQRTYHTSLPEVRHFVSYPLLRHSFLLPLAAASFLAIPTFFYVSSFSSSQVSSFPLYEKTSYQQDVSFPSPTSLPPDIPFAQAQDKTLHSPSTPVYGYGPDPTLFIRPQGIEKQRVITTIDSWNNTVSFSSLPSPVRDGIYRVEKREGYADFLFIENNIVKGTASYKLGQPRFLHS